MKKAVVLGLGVSGLAAVEFLQRKGYRVIGVDRKVPIQEGLDLFSDQEPLDWAGVELMVVSPGIDLEHRLVVEGRERGVEILGEAELALRHLKQPAVAITGTNGKTTVTLLTEHILKTAGIPAKALGNVGTALTSYLLHPDPTEVLVVELSSYQLETLEAVAFDAGVLLNITPDHLERHKSMEGYARAKFRLQKCLKPGAPFYVQTQAAQGYGSCGHETYGSVGGSCYETNKVVAKYFENVEYFLPIGYRNLGIHESENALAAWVLCKQFRVSPEQFCQALETFRKPPHRIEYVAEIDRVCFYDDSKGTNVDAVVQAVLAMEGPVILIAGGLDKGSSYLRWKEAFQGKVKKIIAIGQAAPKIYRELNPHFDMELAETLALAVEASMRHASPGDHVLLSPGCSSYDMFCDYAHRGKEFQRFVTSLRERKS